MSDLTADVIEGGKEAAPFEDLPAWRELEREFAAGDIPHCRAVSAPAPWHAALLDRLSRLTLGAGPGEHPDLLVVGEVGKAPDIAACRGLIQDLALKPVSAPRRLGVVMAADRLLLPAANSLLKLAEEPPSHACLLFLLEGNGLLPTLRSRARFTMLSVPLEAEALPPPLKDSEWLAWVEGARGGDAARIAEFLMGWGAWALSQGNVTEAAKLEGLRLIAETKNLSVPMLCDLVILALREGLPFERLFGDFR